MLSMTHLTIIFVLQTTEKLIRNITNVNNLNFSIIETLHSFHIIT